MVLWGPTLASQQPTTIQAVDGGSGTVLTRLGIGSTTAIRVHIVGSSTTLDTTTTVESVTVVNVVSTTVVGPLTTSVQSATTFQGTSPWVTSFSTTQNVLSYPTGVTSTTQTGPYTVVFNTTQNVLSYPTGVTSATQVGPFTVVHQTTARTLTGTATTVYSGTQQISTLSDSLVRVFDGTSQQQLDPCQTRGGQSTPININGVNNTRLITATASQRTYICALSLFAAGTVNVGVVAGTGNQCATNTTGLYGGTTAATGLNLVAQTGIAWGAGNSWVMATSQTGYDFCLITSATQQVAGSVKWVQQ